MVKEIIVFEARDGKQFSTPSEARMHEAGLDIEGWESDNSCYNELNDGALIDKAEEIYGLLEIYLAAKTESEKAK